MSASGAFRVILSELESVGLDPAAMCAEAGVDPRVLHDDTVPLGVDQLGRVLAQAQRTTGDALLGVHVAERARGRGVLSYLARSQQTVGEGLEAFARFASSRWDSPGVVTVERRSARVFLVFRLSDALSRHAVEYVVMRAAISLRRSGATVVEVSFRHPPGGPAKDYERAVRCPVRFRHDQTALSLRAADLALPLRLANPDAARALAVALARPAAQCADTVTARLATLIDETLARGGRSDREGLARALGMSGRTLARRLAAEQRLFSDVVDDVRRTLARRLVTEEGLDLGEVAARVGFADLAAFGKAFRRWFGMSPSAFRTRRAHG